jgi:dimethylhistidine N-methyltransferase
MREISPGRLSAPPVPDPQFADDVQYYLSLQPRQLPSRYFYDPLGSALFEAICRLPWYHVTRAEERLLDVHAREIFELASRPTHLVELGSGSGDKLARLIERGWVRPGHLDVELVDVSGSALDAARHRLSTIEGVSVSMHQASYQQGLISLSMSSDRRTRTLMLFLGSNLGNFDRPDAEVFLQRVRSALMPGDAFLIGTDLVKPERDLLLAYDDPLGVTAAFNRNLLVRVNRELGADFDLSHFHHRAIWNPEESRVEMHLLSEGRQHVRIGGTDVELTFEDGESIWTESSYKFEMADVVERLAGSHFSPLGQWVDQPARFGLTLARAV